MSQGQTSRSELLFVCAFSPSHEKLFSEWLQPSLERFGYSYHVISLPQLCKTGSFATSGWKEQQLAKVRAYADFLSTSETAVTVFLDADIQILADCRDFLNQALQENEIAFQLNSAKDDFVDICSGFFACRKTPNVMRLFSEVCAHLETRIKYGCTEDLGEQLSFRECLMDTTCRWATLDPNQVWCPGRFYRSVYELRVPKGLLVHHANWTKGLQSKIEQLKYVRSYATGKNLLSAVFRSPWARGYSFAKGATKAILRRMRKAILLYENFAPIRAMIRESNAAWLGMRRFKSNQVSVSSTNYILRRNTHRLEKALISFPRKKIFAQDYIQETVEAYSQTLRAFHDKQLPFLRADLVWAQAVLEEYFRVVLPTPKVEKSLRIFSVLSHLEKDELSLRASRPNTRQTQPTILQYDRYLDLVKARKSVRFFTKEKVPRELLDQAVEAARYAPSACNRQPFEFRIFDDPELVSQLARIPGGTAGFYQHFPSIIVLVGDLSAFFDPRDRHVIYIDGSLAAMSFILAAESLGLATCCINWPDLEDHERRLRSVMKLEPHQRVIMFLAIGFPDKERLVPSSVKKDISAIRSYNRLTNDMATEGKTSDPETRKVS